MTKSETRKLVEISISSIFSKEDVLKLIDDMTSEFNITQVNALVDLVIDELDVRKCVDFQSAEFDLQGSTIILSDIQIDYDVLQRDLVDLLKDNLLS